MNERKGFLLVLLTAIISGVSIFANSFAVQSFNPFVFAFLKNAAVAIFLFSLLLLFKDFSSLKKLSKKHWLQLMAIGLAGGSIPFLLFFYALQGTTAINAGFLHKTIFIWASFFAFFFLKEKISPKFLLVAVLLLAGNFLLFSISSFGFAEALILLAAVLWAAENAISKRVLKELPGTIVAFGRMFFGSIFILAFLASTSQIVPAFEISIAQLQWVFITSAFLAGYVFTFYSGLKHLPLHKAAALLLLAQPITIILSFAFLGTAVSIKEAFGLLLTLAGIFLAAGMGYSLNALKARWLLLAHKRN